MVAGLTATEAHHLAGHDAIVLNTRRNVAFGRGHIPGAINVGLAPDLPAWVGWLVSADVSMLLVMESDEHWGTVVTMLARVATSALRVTCKTVCLHG